jgi:glycosyltransferase involved in cell wall biosynthesis
VRLLWLSNLFHAKGIETLLAACAILRNQGIVCDLTIAGAEGDISERDLFALLSKYQMQATTNWLGPVFGTAKQTAFENADLFAFPSHYANEAQPLVVLEAMAAGVPVITSNIATLPEFVRNGETGRLCPAKNPAKLATEIIAALTAPKHTNAMRDAAYHMCQRDFSHSRFATNLCQLVDSIIKNR